MRRDDIVQGSTSLPPSGAGAWDWRELGRQLDPLFGLPRSTGGTQVRGDSAAQLELAIVRGSAVGAALMREAIISGAEEAAARLAAGIGGGRGVSRETRDLVSAIRGIERVLSQEERGLLAAPTSSGSLGRVLSGARVLAQATGNTTVQNVVSGAATGAALAGVLGIAGPVGAVVRGLLGGLFGGGSSAPKEKPGREFQNTPEGFEIEAYLFNLVAAQQAAARAQYLRRQSELGWLRRHQQEGGGWYGGRGGGLWGMSDTGNGDLGEYLGFGGSQAGNQQVFVMHLGPGAVVIQSDTVEGGQRAFAGLVGAAVARSRVLAPGVG